VTEKFIITTNSMIPSTRYAGRNDLKIIERPWQTSGDLIIHRGGEGKELIYTAFKNSFFGAL
jgi:hypothetical protein